MPKRLFLLDAYALIYRAYYSFINNPRKTNAGFTVSAAYGFTNALVEVLEKENPTHIGVVFDPGTPTFRHEMYKEYKAQRPPTPEDIKSNVPYIKQITEAMQIPVLSVDGYEADDVIGTLAHKAKTAGFEVFMMTPDKDFCQLVDEHVKMLKPKRSGNDAEVWGIPEVQKKYGVEHPAQVIDVLAMWGDSSDNIPGIPGVGEKTAINFIKKFRSLEGLYENTDKLKGKQKQNVLENKDEAFLAKKLVTIKTDVDIDFDEEALRFKGYDEEKLKAVFDELEFRTLARRLFSQNQAAQQGDLFASAEENTQDSAPAPQQGTIETVAHAYHLVDSPAELDRLTGQLAAQPAFCLDTETTSVYTHTARILGIAFSWKAHEGYYVPLNTDNGQERLAKLRPVLENPNTEKVAHNLKFDLQVLHYAGISLKGKFYDTMLAHYLLHPGQKHNMDEVARQYLNYSPVPIESLIGKKGRQQSTLDTLPLERLKEYAAEDADITWQLRNALQPKLEGLKLDGLFARLEVPLIEVLSDLEITGVRIDPSALHDYVDELRQRIRGIEQDIYKEAGSEFNIASTQQLGKILFDRMEITPKPKKTKTGQYATGEKELQKLQDKHPIIGMVLAYRQLSKLLNTYVEPLPQLINERTGRIHTSYNQAVAATGRLSSTHPNLQNIPIRAEEGRRIRKAFVPSDENHILLAADYSQIELRIIAHLSGDEGMLEAFRHDLDIHAATAAKIYNIALDQVDREKRGRAKSANFGIVYGISAFGLSQNLGIPRSEAKTLIDGYFSTYPKVKTFMDAQIKGARDKGYVSTLMGRRRYLPEINSRNHVVRGVAERNAINAPIQGSAADIIKKAMLDVYHELQKRQLQTRMILQIHDELIFDVPRNEREEVRTLVKNLMEQTVSLDVPLTVETGEGQNWLEAH